MKRSVIEDLCRELFIAREKAIREYQYLQIERDTYLKSSDEWASSNEKIDIAENNVEIADDAVEHLLQLDCCMRHLNLFEDSNHEKNTDEENPGTATN